MLTHEFVFMIASANRTFEQRNEPREKPHHAKEPWRRGSAWRPDNGVSGAMCRETPLVIKRAAHASPQPIAFLPAEP
jgi:hypothetical protein